MLDINFVPEKLRKKKRKSRLPGGTNIPLEIIIGVGGGFLSFLFLVHVILAVINYSKVAQNKGLQKEWEEILPQKQNADAVIKELRSLQQKYKDLTQITEGTKISWSQKLNILSDSLPSELWIRKIALADDMFLIEGSAISRQNQEMNAVLDFTAELKEQDAFMKHLKEFELGSIYRRSIKNVEVADFLITIKVEMNKDER